MRLEQRSRSSSRSTYARTAQAAASSSRSSDTRSTNTSLSPFSSRRATTKSSTTSQTQTHSRAQSPHGSNLQNAVQAEIERQVHEFSKAAKKFDNLCILQWSYAGHSKTIESLCSPLLSSGYRALDGAYLVAMRDVKGRLLADCQQEYTEILASESSGWERALKDQHSLNLRNVVIDGQALRGRYKDDFDKELRLIYATIEQTYKACLEERKHQIDLQHKRERAAAKLQRSSRRDAHQHAQRDSAVQNPYTKLQNLSDRLHFSPLGQTWRQFQRWRTWR